MINTEVLMNDVHGFMTQRLETSISFTNFKLSKRPITIRCDNITEHDIQTIRCDDVIRWYATTTLSKRNLTFNLLDPNQIRLTLRYTNIMNDWLNPCGLEPQLIKLEFIIYLPKLKVVVQWTGRLEWKMQNI